MPRGRVGPTWPCRLGGRGRRLGLAGSLSSSCTSSDSEFLRAVGSPTCHENSPERALSRAQSHLCLDREAGIIEPADHLAKLTAMDVDLHRMAAVAFGDQARLVTDVETE